MKRKHLLRMPVGNEDNFVITQGPIIHKILRHLGLWESDFSPLRHARDPPPKTDAPKIMWIPIEDAWHEKSLPTDFSTRVSHETLGWAAPDQPDIMG